MIGKCAQSILIFGQDAVLWCAWSLSRVQLFVTPWTAAHQSPLSLRILQARILEWVAMPSSGGSSQPRDRTQVFLHCKKILYHLSHQGSPRILECVAYPFSRGSFQPRSQTGVSCIAGGFFTSWATREALGCSIPLLSTDLHLQSGFSTALLCYASAALKEAPTDYH